MGTSGEAEAPFFDSTTHCKREASLAGEASAASTAQDTYMIQGDALGGRSPCMMFIFIPRNRNLEQ